MNRYRASYIRRGDCSGIGIVEIDDMQRTVAIHSLFYPTSISKRDACVNAFQFISLDERRVGKALLYMHGVSTERGWHVPFKSQIQLRGRSSRHAVFKQANELAADAIKRGNSISEVLT